MRAGLRYTLAGCAFAVDREGECEPGKPCTFATLLRPAPRRVRVAAAVAAAAA